VKPYNISDDKGYSWEKCTLRSWLNGYAATANDDGEDYATDSFIDSAFSPSEKDAIKITSVDNSVSQARPNNGLEYDDNDTNDKLFLLSYKECSTNAYGFMPGDEFDSARCANVTAFANERVTNSPSENCIGWWIRTPLVRSPGILCCSDWIAATGQAAFIYFHNIRTDIGVRPALHISASSSQLYPAGTVCSDGTVDEKAKPEEDIREEFKVTFDTMGGTPVSAVSVKSGDKLAKPADPTRDGFSFTGWFTDEACTKAWDFDKNEVSSNMTLYAGWKANGSQEPEEKESSLTLIPGEVARLSLDDTDKYIPGAKWTIVSTDPKGCISLKNGIVTANTLKKTTEGKAVVKAVCGNTTTTFNITVNAKTPERTPIVVGKKNYQIAAPVSITVNAGTTKTVAVKIPAYLRSDVASVSYEILSEGICETGEPTYDKEDRKKATKAVFTVKGLEAGGTYIVWSLKDTEGNETKTYTKVIVKKPLAELVISEKTETPLEISVGQGMWLTVTGTNKNTSADNLSFSVKGKGLKISKTGYLVATAPEGSGTVTVKAGRISNTISVKVSAHEGNYLALDKTSVSLGVPKQGAKPSTTTLKVSIPKNKADKPVLRYSIAGAPSGITISDQGVISVDGTARPGCYEISAYPADADTQFNKADCELVVK